MLIPCEVLIDYEIFKDKDNDIESTTEQVYKMCVLVGFGTEMGMYEEDDEEIPMVTTVAIIQLVGERVLRKVPVENLQMQEVLIKGNSNIVVPGRKGN